MTIKWTSLKKSSESFMKSMQGVAQPQSINDFVCAVINNGDIETTKASLLSNIRQSITFFTPNESIQSKIDQVDALEGAYWGSRGRHSPESTRPKGP